MRAGFTLFEVAISLLVMATVVTLVVMMVPVGMKAQSLARYQLYASAKAVEIADVFAGFHTCNPSMEAEAPNPWDIATSYGGMAYDLDKRLPGYRQGLFPLPGDIARRLDSDDDEIQRLLDAGAQLYYAQPMAANNFKTVTHFVNDGVATPIDLPPPNEAQKLVFAVVGHAQHNAIPVFPWKAWPYHAAYPSPPMHGVHSLGGWNDSATNTYEFEERKYSLPADCLFFPMDRGLGGTNVFKAPGSAGEGHVLLEDLMTGDRDIRNVYQTLDGPVDATGAKNYGYIDYRVVQDRPAAIRYLQAALWYCARKGVNPADYEAATDQFRTIDWAAELRAVRYLAHAAVSLTAFGAKDPMATPPFDLTMDALVPVVVLTAPDGTSSASAAWTVSEARIRGLHESCLRLAMRFAAERPYDWGAPRPLNRQIMMDYPLIEYDLFSGSFSPTGVFSGGVSASALIPGATDPGYGLTPRWSLRTQPTGAPVPGQWKPITPQPITNLGRSYGYPRIKLPAEGAADSIWGDRARFTLTRPFAPAERCRQIVFWAVDWMSYEDVETAPSAPVDASRYCIWSPKLSSYDGSNFASRLSPSPRWQDWHQFSYRNPEKAIAFTVDPEPLATGTDMRNRIHGPDDIGGNQKDHGTSTAQRSIFLGRWGADRNFNGRLDRGPVPRSARLRAVTVARFNLYDPRIPVPTR